MVAIIGRPNVGKSTLFNRILGERRAVVHDRPGITRDRNTARAEWSGRPFLLVDTGGFLPGAAEGRDANVRRQAEIAIGLAHAVLFMVDAKTGVTDLDLAIARDLRRRGAKCLLVVNKVDRAGRPVGPRLPPPRAGRAAADLLGERTRDRRPARRGRRAPAPGDARRREARAAGGHRGPPQRRQVLDRQRAPARGPGDRRAEGRHDHGLDRHGVEDAGRDVHPGGHRRDPPRVALPGRGRVLRHGARAERPAARRRRLPGGGRGAGLPQAGGPPRPQRARRRLQRAARLQQVGPDRGARGGLEAPDRRAGRALPDARGPAGGARLGHREDQPRAACPKLILQRAEEHGRKIPTPRLNEWLAAVQEERGVPSTKAGHSPGSTTWRRRAPARPSSRCS